MLTATMMIFGNGWGLGAPYFDQPMYWLVDTLNGRSAGRGRFYSWIGGFGAQLSSYEWRCPRPGTTRRLAGTKFSVFNVSRGRFGLMWNVSWAASLPKDINQANAAIREIKRAVQGEIITR